MPKKGEGEGGAAEALGPVVKNTHLQSTGQGAGLVRGVEGLDRTGRRFRDSLKKTAVGTDRDRAGTHTAIGLLRRRCNEAQE